MANWCIPILANPSIKIARIYLRVSTDEQDLTRQTEIEQSTRAAGYYVAGVYREKASGARADRPELQRMIAAYAASKGAIAQLTKVIALEHGEQGIRANAIGAGVIETDILAGIVEDSRATLASYAHMH